MWSNKWTKITHLKNRKENFRIRVLIKREKGTFRWSGDIEKLKLRRGLIDGEFDSRQQKECWNETNERRWSPETKIRWPKTYLRISSMAVAPAIEEREKREHQRSSETEKSWREREMSIEESEKRGAPVFERERRVEEREREFEERENRGMKCRGSRPPLQNWF